MPLVAIPETLLREVEGHAIFSVWLEATPGSGVTGRFDWWRPTFQFITSRFWSGVGEGVGGSVVCHILVSRLRVLCVPWDLRILVKRVVFPTEPPLGAQGGGCDIGNWGLGGA